MVPEMEKPRVTEIQVRIDCNGCVQKIKKALHGINGICDIYIDIPQQKLTIIGWADPEKIVKAIKKTRKAATICSGTEPAPPAERPSEGGAPSNPPPEEIVPPAEPVEPPKEPENPLAEATPESAQAPEPGAPTPAQEPPSTDSTARQPPQPSGSKEAEEVHVVYHYPPGHSYRYGDHDGVYNASVEHYSSTPSPLYKHEPPQPIHVTDSYNTYKPTPYVTEHKYIRPPPQHTHYSRPETPQQFSKPEPPPQVTHYSRREPPQQYTHYSRHEPPEQYTHNRPEPPRQHTHYSRPEPPQQYTHYNRPEPPPLYTHYSRPEPPSQYAQYNRPEPPQPYRNYGRPEPPPLYAHYSGEYHSSSNGNGNITSIFSDENPNACTIV